MERGTSMLRVIAACVMLTLLAGLAACDAGPAPLPLVPTPTPTVGATAIVAPTIIVSSEPSGTPRRIVPPRLLRPNPLAVIREDDFAFALSPLVDGTYCTQAWSGDDFPATIALPVEPVRGDLLLEWHSSATRDYISFPNANTYGLPASYTIAISTDSTDGRDGTWREVVSVSDNSARTRAHRFSFDGARWVKMTVNSAVRGPLGNTFNIDQINLHDASNGTDDSIFFFGDSITAAAFMRCPANQPSFAELVNQAVPGRYPAMINGGVGGVNSGYGVSVVQEWLDLNPDFRVWAIGYGTNDAWQKVKPPVFEANLRTIVERVDAAGRVPVLARIPFAEDGPEDADVRALNSVIDRLTAEYGLLPGPDLYAWFSAHRDELSSDGVHPTDAGNRSINRLWYEALRPLYDISR